MGALPDYANDPVKPDSDRSSSESDFGKDESSELSLSDDNRTGEFSHGKTGKDNSRDVPLVPKDGNSVITGGTDEDKTVGDIVLNEPQPKETDSEKTAVPDEPPLDKTKVNETETALLFEKNEQAPDFADKRSSKPDGTDEIETTSSVSLKPTDSVIDGVTRFNNIVDGIITDKITESVPETENIIPAENDSSSGEFYISSKYNISQWLSGNAFPVVLSLAYLLLIGGAAAAIWKKLRRH